MAKSGENSWERADFNQIPNLHPKPKNYPQQIKKVQ
jgi:hypothetical protein